ncbi:MAG: hypothetical protein CXT73_03780, partial [Methanobacteriota archaeon]
MSDSKKKASKSKEKKEKSGKKKASAKRKTRMTIKAIQAKIHMKEMFDDSDPDASDDGWDDIMGVIYDRVWDPKKGKYVKEEEVV